MYQEKHEIFLEFNKNIKIRTQRDTHQIFVVVSI